MGRRLAGPSSQRVPFRRIRDGLRSRNVCSFQDSRGSGVIGSIPAYRAARAFPAFLTPREIRQSPALIDEFRQEDERSVSSSLEEWFPCLSAEERDTRSHSRNSPSHVLSATPGSLSREKDRAPRMRVPNRQEEARTQYPTN